MLSLEKIIEWIRESNPEQRAQVAAYVIAPWAVLSFAVAGVYTPGVGLDFGRPMAVSSLQTEISSDGRVTQKQGIALTVEPTETEFTVPFDSASSMWTTLAPEIARANTRRLAVTGSGLDGNWPLRGVNTPVTVVVQAKPGREILIPGGRDALEAWQPQPRRSLTFISSVLFSCVFAFGMSLATGLPSDNRDKHAGGKKGTDPHEDEVVDRDSVNLGPGGIRVIPDPESDREEVPRIAEEYDK